MENNKLNNSSDFKSDHTDKVIMYHDGECPLCQFEVKTMQKLDTSNAIHWVDITKDKEALKKAGISYEKAMARIHVKDENQKMLTGVRGFMAVWKHLPYYRRIVPVINHVPFLLPVCEFFYTIFAKYRLPLTGKKTLQHANSAKKEI